MRCGWSISELLLSIGLGLLSGHFAYAEPVPLTPGEAQGVTSVATSTKKPSQPQPIQVRRLDDGRWIGWVDATSGRTRIDVPQTPESIRAFATERQVDIVWHGGEPTVQSERLVPTTSLPLTPSPAEDEWTSVERTAHDRVATLEQGTVRTQAPEQSSPASQQKPASEPVAKPAPKTNGETKPLSEAEQLARLNRAILSDEQRLQELNDELTSPQSEFVQAEAEFQEVTQRLNSAQEELARLIAEQAPTAELQTHIVNLEKNRDLSRQRLELALQTRRTLQEQISALSERLRQERQARARLTGEAPAPAEHAAGAGNGQAASGEPALVNPAAAAVEGSTAPSAKPAEVPATTAAAPTASPAAAVSPPANGAPAEQAADPLNPELQKAKELAALKDDAAREAEREVESLSERIANLDRNIELERKQYSVARQRSEVAYQQQQGLEAEFVKLSLGGTADAADLRELSQRVERAAATFASARQEFRSRTERLHELEIQRTELQSELIAALNTAKSLREAAESAEQRVATLKNPFSLLNILQWLLDHGVKILVILIGMLALRTIISATTQRIVNMMVQRGMRGTTEERTDRANTLAGVFHNAGTMTIMTGGCLMICEEVGIAVAPLLGGAAVLGLAVAFGAQNLIRDYFYGFVILLENQYKLNDVLKIGDISGQVERITLRMTVLRDIEGRVHFIPNGKIDSVTNMTHGWSRALVDVSVAYKEDADRVMQVLLDVAAELRRDEKFGPLITDDAEMLGVDSLAESGITIRFFVKTRPLKQWAVRRELLRRIKRRFDQLAIEIPFPHRTVYHHQVESPSTVQQAGDERWEHRKSA